MICGEYNIVVQGQTDGTFGGEGCCSPLSMEPNFQNHHHLCHIGTGIGHDAVAPFSWT